MLKKTDLPVTLQMSKLYNHYPVSVLHLEPTDVCQASCPLCQRELNPKFDKKVHRHLTVKDIQDLFDIPFLESLKKMFMCGNYGDPAAGKHTLDIYRYFKSVNEKINLGMNTNGALQHPDWWEELGILFDQEDDYVVFSIDGLEDTNHIYRQGVDWSRLMENVRAFISTGARAQWDMLVYEHNEHQVDQCEALARRMGFSWFRAKVSKRQNTVDWLKPPKFWKRPEVTRGKIDCFVEKEQSIYVSAKKQVHPCCWLGQDSTYQYGSFPAIKQLWNTESCNPVCHSHCLKDDEQTNFTKQWQRTIKLC